jgi:hypothetical protein
MAYGDGLIYRAVAARINAPPDLVNPVVASRGTSLRYGRIGFPALIWAAAGGHPPAMPYSQPVLTIVIAGAASAGAVAFFPAAGGLSAFLPFLAPGFPLAIAGGYAEILAIALSVWAVWFMVAQRPWVASMLLGVAVLTKENAVFVLAGLALWAMFRRRLRSAFILALSLIPVIGWYAYIAIRYGHIPPLDPYLRVTTTTVGPPVVSLARSLHHAASTESFVMTVLHLGLLVVALLIARHSLLGLIAAVASLQVLIVGPFGWKFIGDAARISSTFELFTILGFLAYLRPSWVDARLLLHEQTSERLTYASGHGA